MVQQRINRGRHTDHPAGATLSGLTSAHLHHPPIFFTGRMPFLPPNQQCQSTAGRVSASINLCLSYFTFFWWFQVWKTVTRSCFLSLSVVIQWEVHSQAAGKFQLLWRQTVWGVCVFVFCDHCRRCKEVCKTWSKGELYTNSLCHFTLALVVVMYSINLSQFFGILISLCGCRIWY